MSNLEKINVSHEGANPEALEKAGEKQHEQLRQDLERAPEKQPDNPERIKQEALEAAARHEQEPIRVERTTSPAERRKGPIGKSERDASFKASMKEIQSHMSASSRNFSKVIHNKAVEKTSETVGATIARPNAILSGAVAAFIFTLGVYLVAKNFGYPLSGFETIGAFLLGWILGLCYDFLRIMITGRKS